MPPLARNWPTHLTTAGGFPTHGRDRAKLWSVLWYDFQPFTDLYLTLYEGLEKLAFAPEALLSMDALIPREKSIIDVLTLDKLGADAGDTLLVRPKTADRRTLPDARLPRSLDALPLPKLA